MHIGFLTPEFPHNETNNSGGLGSSIKNLVQGLLKEGVKVSVFIYGQKKNKLINEDGLTIHLIAQRHYPVLTWWFYRKFLQNYINSYTKKHHIDLIEAPDWTGITALMNFKVPSVIRMNGSDAYFCYLEERKQKFKNRFFEKLALKNADHLVSVSKFAAKITKNIFQIEKPIEIIPNGINAINFKPDHSKINSNEILYFGTIIRKKGVLELAHIFNELSKKNKEIQLTLIGKDVKDIFEKKSTIELFKEIIDNQNINRIEWQEEIPYEEVSQRISKAQVIVLPSFAEAMPMTWLEAMAMEKALVTSNIGWAAEVMEDGITGYTVAPKMHKEFSDKIKELIDDPQLAKRMGSNARERILEKFSNDIVVKKNLELYFQICLKN
jgi:L-malate glycosyltransferase